VARTKAFDPKPGDVGSVLVWTDWHGNEHIGEVLADHPTHGRRWVLGDDGAWYVLHVQRSGRHAGRVTQHQRHEPDWQRQTVRALDRLSRTSSLRTSREQETVPGWQPGATRVRDWLRYHVDGCPDADASHPFHYSAHGAHRWLLAHIAEGRDRFLDLHDCITGEPAAQAVA
jgi:hypothetical protein